MRAVAVVVAALGFVLAPSCAVVLGEDDGNRVRVVLAATQWPDHDDDGAPVTRAGTLRRADGSEVIIERAYIAWSRVQLVPCGELLMPARINAARAAHGPDTSLAVTSPLLDMLLPRPELLLAELHPPSGAYCRAVIGAAASDPAVAPVDLDMRGASMLVDGFWRASPTAPWQAFLLRESAAFDVTVQLGEREIANGATLEILLSRSADAWLDGVDLAAPDAARDLLARLHESTTVALR